METTAQTGDPRDSHSFAVDAAGETRPQAPALDLRQLHRHIAGFIEAAHGVEETTKEAAAFLARLTNAQLVVYFTVDASGSLAPAAEHRVAVSDEIGNYWRGLLAEQAAKACAENRLQITRLQQTRVAISVPVPCHGAKIDSLAAVFLLGAERAETFVVILQLVAGLLSAYHHERANQATEWEIGTSCAMLDLIVSIGKADSVVDAGVLVANAVKNYLGCERVALGLRKRRGTSCKLLAISGMSDLNQQAEMPQAVQAVLAESVRGGTWTVWPPEKGQNQPLLPAHARLSTVCEEKKVCSAPLRDARRRGHRRLGLLGNRVVRRPMAHRAVRPRVGGAHRMHFATAQAWADEPGQAFDPQVAAFRTLVVLDLGRRGRLALLLVLALPHRLRLRRRAGEEAVRRRAFRRRVRKEPRSAGRRR